ncbi:hypothetical protein L7F22_060248 [Adiantum nelumboides]|nr:hypothetical protein [Adiantum nelumboides]
MEEFRCPWLGACCMEDMLGRQVLQQMNMQNLNTLDSLIELGPKRLRCALVNLGLKTGGTIEQRAKILLLTKQQASLQELVSTHSNSYINTVKELAIKEMKVQQLCKLLCDTIECTREHVLRKEILTRKEDLAEKLDDYVGDDCVDLEEERMDAENTYNPLKLPIGVDGRPIPYWLYKLHGLDQEFRCEICGNATYRGRRAFEQHFSQKQHQHGLACLGIRNGRAFHEITTIHGAKSLWITLQRKKSEETWHSEVEEEHEDHQGNVYNRIFFMMLKREGFV